MPTTARPGSRRDERPQDAPNGDAWRSLRLRLAFALVAVLVALGMLLLFG